MEPTFTSETKEKGRNNFSTLMKMFNKSKPADSGSNESLPKSVEELKKNIKTSKIENITDNNIKQLDPEVPTGNSKPREEKLTSEKEAPSKITVADFKQSDPEIPVTHLKPDDEELRSEKEIFSHLTDCNIKQAVPEILASHIEHRDEELMAEKETASKEVTELLQPENKVSMMDNSSGTGQTDFTVETPIKRIPIETALDDLHTMDVEANQPVSEIAMPEDSSVSSDQAKTVLADTDTIVDSIRHETHEVSFTSTQDKTLQEHNNLQEFHTMQPPVTNVQTSDPKADNTVAESKMNKLRKKSESSAMSLKEKQQASSKSSQSSLYSSGPSSSSLCHLTELSQPKPEALRKTLMCLRHLHGKDAEHLVNIERHLRGLRSGPKTKSDHKTNESSVNNATARKQTGKAARTPQTKPLEADDDANALGERQALDKFAANLFAQLERKRALENYEVSRLKMPVEIGYYRAAYDALATIFGQPYHKCTLELYQQLAGELGVEAEIFVMDQTPKITNVEA